MKIVAITRCSLGLQRILKIVQKVDVVLRSSKGGEFLLSQIDDFDYELAAQRRNKKLMDFLDERIAQARKQEGIPLAEVKRRLGASSRAARRSPSAEEVVKTIAVSPHARAIARLLAEARAEELVLRTGDGSEYALTAIRDGDRNDAKRRLSDVVTAYLASLPDDCLPPLEVVFTQRFSAACSGRREAQARQA